ncbi:MAG: UDP-N-acetylmuramoyl-L-alanine--D-glutamate ligase [Anaerolineae bacterium]|nr:UDP-N-acetylmuramoyl-L-alanine--D-glutamate ligase [Anaerolineae bacterium]
MDDPLSGKRVAIIGLARQGTALARWLCENGAQVVVSDMRTEDQLAEPMAELADYSITYILGDHPDYLLNRVDLVCLSGGVPLDAPIVQEAVKRDIPLSNDAQLFLDRCPCHVIGITGSAGKTTTTSLVGKMCEAAGKLPWVGGNIGNPLITDLPFIQPNDIVVMELSSFQLEIMSTSPHVAAILNITPNHLDRHKSMIEYIEAKAQIIENQFAGDVAVLNRDDPHTYEMAVQGRVVDDLSLFSAQFPVDVGAWLVGDRLLCRPQFTIPMDCVCTINEIPLRGHHNVVNVLAASAIAGAAGVPVEAMREAVLAFKSVPHRLEEVGKWQGVTFINDSIATAPERVLAALEAYEGESLVLLLGGRDKKLPWDALAQRAVVQCHYVITFGEAGLMIAEQIAKARKAARAETRLEQVGTLDDAVDLAVHAANEGDIVLLSPGCTSYDAYRDFEERGEAFRKMVRKL